MKYLMVTAPMQSIASSNKPNISLEAKKLLKVPKNGFVLFGTCIIYTGNPLYYICQVFCQFDCEAEGGSFTNYIRDVVPWLLKIKKRESIAGAAMTKLRG